MPARKNTDKMRNLPGIEKVISSGQTGVDRAALDVVWNSKFPVAAGVPKVAEPKTVLWKRNILYRRLSLGIMCSAPSGISGILTEAWWSRGADRVEELFIPSRWLRNTKTPVL